MCRLAALHLLCRRRRCCWCIGSPLLFLIDLSPPDRCPLPPTYHHGSSEKTTPHDGKRGSTCMTCVRFSGRRGESFSYVHTVFFSTRVDRFAARPATASLACFASPSPSEISVRPISPHPTGSRYFYFLFILVFAQPTYSGRATTRSSLILTIQWDQKRESVINIASI